MLRKVVLLAAGCAVAAGALRLAGADVATLVSWRPFILVTLYTAVLVLARFSPGCIMHRLAVLNRPDRHVGLEITKARQFATYAGTRLLFAGLIFTLIDIASVVAKHANLIEASGTLSTALWAALYSLTLYLIVFRAANHYPGDVPQADLPQGQGLV